MYFRVRWSIHPMLSGENENWSFSSVNCPFPDMDCRSELLKMVVKAKNRK